ncbi:MAG: hypothetical protein R3F12_07300 [Lysobacteraceae bacterium]
MARVDRLSASMVLMLTAGLAQATDIGAQGYIDLRLVDTAREPSWIEGGLGKLRWGDGADSVAPSAAVNIHAQLAPEWLANASLQAQPDSHAAIETLEAWLRYRPVSTSPWRWSLRAGAFFPPISLENDGVGWSMPAGITPSAINSWVGEELRSTGIEWRIEHRALSRTFSAGLTVFGGNDPAGEILAARGWSLSDRYQGFGGRLREPDITARNTPPPRDFDPFVENDHAAGWHADIDIDSRSQGRWRAMYYDNRTDPTTFREHDGEHVYSWHTRFWSLGHQREIGGMTLTAQAMLGDTTFKPGGRFTSTTDFWSGFVSLARSRGDWRPMLRFEQFGTREHSDGSGGTTNEHGNAVTAALVWRPAPRWRLSAEWLRVDSSRTSRPEAGFPEDVIDHQTQLSLRWFF